MISVSTARFLVKTRQKMARLASCGLPFHNTHGSHLPIRHAWNRRNASPLQIEETQLGLLPHLCISFLWEGKWCVCVCVCVIMHMSCERCFTITDPSMFYTETNHTLYPSILIFLPCPFFSFFLNYINVICSGYLEKTINM